MIPRFAVVPFAVLFLTLTISGFGAEHPGTGLRQPDIRKQTSGPTPPQTAPQVTAADVSAGIKKNVKSESKKSADKKFHVKYQRKDLALGLVKIHEDSLSNMGNGKYFACVDMKAADGTVYDIDFFMTGQPGAMRVTETAVHKVNGKPLYNWKAEGGGWKKVAL